MKKLIFSILMCINILAYSGIGMNASDIYNHYNYRVCLTDTVIELGNIRMYYNVEKDIVYEQWVDVIPYKANEFFQLLKKEYPITDEPGWFLYSENIIVCVRMDVKTMRNHYIHFKLINY